jgi:heptaprenylglyceryl phosphate synthase
LCDDLAAAGKLDEGVECDPDSNESSQVVGRIVKMNADDIGVGGTPVEESSFLKIVRLVR